MWAHCIWSWEQRKEAFSVLLQICLGFVLRHCRVSGGTEPVLSWCCPSCVLIAKKCSCLVYLCWLLCIASVPSCRRDTHPSEAACALWLWWASWGTAASSGRGFAVDGDLSPRNLDSRPATELCQPGLCSSTLPITLTRQYQVFSSILHSPAESLESFHGFQNLGFFSVKRFSRCSGQDLSSQYTLDGYNMYSLLCSLHWTAHWMWWGFLRLVLPCPGYDLFL